MSVAVAVADIRKRFLARMDDHTKTAEIMEKALHNTQQPEQPLVDKNGWSGDLFDLKGMAKPFDRSEHVKDLNDAIRNPAKPGTVSDLIVTSLQGDHLACQERAFRTQHASVVRRLIHPTGRMLGFRHPAGVFRRGHLEHLAAVVRRGHT